MDILSIIEKKRYAKELSKEEIKFFIENYTNDQITDYQAAALIMAICINGMTADEILNLTNEMANSGEVLDLTPISKNIVDKHSTGGIGDKVTLLLCPIIAALGIPVAKMSGRGLGITGGTADKIESIPGYNTMLSTEEFIANVKEIGVSLITQTANLAPADKKIYALRDTIGCAKSMPLIASSIMCKKIAAGANHIILDVTCGSGAFMKNITEARSLAKMMNLIGKWANKDTKCLITAMNEPLGYAVGNSLEVIEAINFLKGDMPEDVREVIFTVGSYMIKAAGKGDDIEANKEKIAKVIKNKKALNKFKQMVERQGGDTSYIDNTDKFKKAKYIMPVIAEESGYVSECNAEKIGQICLNLGAGRKKKTDKIDFAVGVTLCKKVSDKVEEGEILAYIHANNSKLATDGVEQMQDAYKIVKNKVRKPNTILEVI